MYSFKEITNNWYLENHCWTNDLFIKETDTNIDDILNNIIYLIKTYKCLDYDLKAIAENNIFNGAEYVASNTKYTYSSKSDLTFYDEEHIISIPKSDGTFAKGIIRISDHEVDLQTWEKNNKKFDFGISFVIHKTTSEWKGNNIIETSNRRLCIYEYVFEPKYNNTYFLDNLIAEILNIKRTGIYIPLMWIGKKRPEIITNIIESLMSNIKKDINKKKI